MQKSEKSQQKLNWNLYMRIKLGSKCQERKMRKLLIADGYLDEKIVMITQLGLMQKDFHRMMNFTDRKYIPQKKNWKLRKLVENDLENLY